jgi:hypothetical protein
VRAGHADLADLAAADADHAASREIPAVTADAQQRRQVGRAQGEPQPMAGGELGERRADLDVEPGPDAGSLGV